MSPDGERSPPPGPPPAFHAEAIKDPNKLALAVGGLYSSWLAVQGTLRLEFARTVTLGVSMAEMATPAALRLGVPVLAHLVPAEYHHWIPMMIRTATRALAVSIAWRLQVAVSAVHLAMRGGLLFTTSLLRYIRSRRYLSRAAADQADGVAQVTGYVVAALGFYCQFSWGFGLPFPLNVFMMPVNVIEWFVRYSVTSSAAIA